MGKEFVGLTDEELCDLMCGCPEEDYEEEDDDMRETMDVFNEEPREVVCIRNEKDDWFPHAELLEVGKKYNVIEVYRGSWHTDVVLEEFPNLMFNSCTFAEVDS